MALPKILVTRDLSSPVFPVSGWLRCFEPVPRCSHEAGALLAAQEPAHATKPSSDMSRGSVFLLAGYQAGWEPSTRTQAAAGTWLDGLMQWVQAPASSIVSPSIVPYITDATF